MWSSGGAGTLEPTDQGEKPGATPQDLPTRKVRPAGLSEALIKLAESVSIEEEMDAIRRLLEPLNLGGGTPDGVAIAVRVLRGWAKSMEEAGALADNDAQTPGERKD